MPTLYRPEKNITDAYCTDGFDEWFGKAPKGAKLTDASWQIVKMEYTVKNWVIKYPIDISTGLGSDAPKFKWGVDGVDARAYSYAVLGCTS
jgi:hypothetical protein